MSKKRVHELAKEMGMENREALEALQGAGIVVKTHSSSVYEEEALAVLKKVKAPEPAAPPRRPGMVIVKKRQHEAEPTAQAPAEAAEAAPVATQEMVAQAPSPEPAHAAPVPQTQPVQAQVVSRPAAHVGESHGVRRGGHEPYRRPPDEISPAQAQAQAQAEVQAQVEAEEQSGQTMQPSAAEPSGEQPPDQASQPAALASEPQAPAPVAPPAQDPVRPGAATVVRMIDREKLLERVPGRRLGGGSPGGGQRFGQVTELKVVNDPFGRGREMVQVGQAKRKPGAAPPPNRGGPAGRKGRGGKRESSDMRERALHPARLKRKKVGGRTTKKTEVTQPRASKRVIRMKETIVVADLAHQLGIKSADAVRRLMAMGAMVTQNQSIDFNTAQLIAAELEFTVDSIAFTENSIIDVAPAQEQEADLVMRPPVVTVMGHVDHGKTSLLDAIRKAKVASGEAGGITQHIGAYSVPVGGKGTVTFLDTPGHAAFTNMRARGAQVTDLVVLVVAADDGVMPQTEEAIRHAQAAKVPIIVAVNKCDKPEANADRVMQELTQFELVPEAWGGDTLYVNTSATRGDGIQSLLESILLQAEVLELRANPNRPAQGVVVEAQLDRGRGPVATILVQHGTLKRGDAVVIGGASGKIRAMVDDTGAMIERAGPSFAVELTGLDSVPEAGDVLNVVESSEKAREVAAYRHGQKRSQEQTNQSGVSLEDLMKRMQGQEQLELKVVLKADVQGSVEAVRGALMKLSTAEVVLNVIHGAAGAINESDVMLAAASGGVVLGFGVRPDTKARQIAERERVDVRTYNIIYEAIDEMRLAMEGLLTPESREKVVGRAEIRELFKVSKVGTIGGSRVIEGKAQRAAKVRVLRDNVQIYEGRVASLRHFKSDVREVDTGLECGIGVEGYNDLKSGDVIEFFTVEEFARTLGAATASTGRESRRSGGGGEAHP